MKPLSPRITLVVIFAVFITPLILAWLMFKGALDFGPDKTRNLGQLVVPPLAVDWSTAKLATSGPSENAQAELEGYWVILHQLPVPCTESCKTLLAGLRQVHRASGRNQQRIRIAFIVDNNLATEDLDKIRKIYPEFKLLSKNQSKLGNSLEKASQSINTSLRKSDFFLADPLGNIMMAYNGIEGPANLSKDLKRLLTWSKLDNRP